MLELNIYIVDAFTKQQFKGNSAAVVPLKNWLAPDVMQSIAAENNLSETAFIRALSANQYDIRWFSPLTEIDFCGHATLAASYVIFNHLGAQGEIEFLTAKVGALLVNQHSDGRIEMSFPNQCPQVVEQVPAALLAGLSETPVQVLRNRQAYFAVMATEQDVKSLTYSSEQLKQLAPYDVVVTAKASAITKEYDFISRYFWPANGGDEDPVTGSIHAGLAPYWARQLDKSELVAYQASQRGGFLFCHLAGDRVLVSGFAVLYLKGTAYL
ncbi:PhzF family phenazine biosynthesis protein [Rheinheimera baltica]|uniref:PhzF family phenazine biosynthesis protein n=1 Tax=Rheinheimera baltica TaxID=67576 RepID=A0ABT9I5S0_9GAMM|nr:PhzF family phenazine biosynthesis protein [Rheinheimera baltica]MDP5138741.1 PhzF family phenazine biosynthesis protein [Rheinheimera baltica]MDP5149722.1 PhzF family phenazine biosynthesis protein [Rheinheimera baltica]